MPRLMLMLCLAAVLAGCNPYLYVNIPPQHGDLARDDANSDIVREVEAEAIRHMLKMRPLAGPVALTLPQGSTELTTADVARRAGEQVRTAQEAPDAEARIDVTQVRIRGTFAEIDMLYPTVTGMQQLLTVHLEYKPMNDWVPQRISDWPGATRAVDHGGASEQP